MQMSRARETASRISSPLTKGVNTHLGGDPRMVRPRHPERVVPAHALPPHNGVLHFGEPKLVSKWRFRGFKVLKSRWSEACESAGVVSNERKEQRTKNHAPRTFVEAALVLWVV
jgi:hypothetical protein